MINGHFLFSAVLFVMLAAGGAGISGFAAERGQAIRNYEIFWRTELFFGRDKNDGTQVTDQEWERFLDEIVTPHFPDGLTVLDAKGQYRLQSGVIAKEQSKVMILFYTPKTRVAVNRKIERIRNEYKRRFAQESVMRVDFRQNIRVSF